MKKMIIRVLITVLISVAIEFVVFQGPRVWKLYKPDSNANQVYYLDSFEAANWEVESDGTLVSLADPMLVLEINNQDIDMLKIQVDASGIIPYVDIFYINDRYPNYGDRHTHYEDLQNNQATIELDDYVQALRIDLGDDPGLRLKEMRVTLNPVSIDVSLSRIIAMIAIYWCGVFLFSLQKMPDYGLDRIAETERE